jgi:hypothetical protein
MQRLVTAFQGNELTIPDGWLLAELEAFEFTYTSSGTRYEAPKGLHDDGVVALALALYGWDRVQCAVPEAVMAFSEQGDDRLALVGAPQASGVQGDFRSQLPTEGW